MYPRMASILCNFTGCSVIWGDMTTEKVVLKVREMDKKKVIKANLGSMGFKC